MDSIRPKQPKNPISHTVGGVYTPPSSKPASPVQRGVLEPMHNFHKRLKEVTVRQQQQEISDVAKKYIRPDEGGQIGPHTIGNGYFISISPGGLVKLQTSAERKDLSCAGVQYLGDKTSYNGKEMPQAGICSAECLHRQQLAHAYFAAMEHMRTTIDGGVTAKARATALGAKLTRMAGTAPGETQFNAGEKYVITRFPNGGYVIRTPQEMGDQNAGFYCGPECDELSHFRAPIDWKENEYFVVDAWMRLAAGYDAYPPSHFSVDLDKVARRSGNT